MDEFLAVTYLRWYPTQNVFKNTIGERISENGECCEWDPQVEASLLSPKILSEMFSLKPRLCQPVPQKCMRNT
jgi:hypothetical protein